MNWNGIHTRILSAERILLTTHENPDGDGLGSAAAMYHFLKTLGKECRIINHSSLPVEFAYLNVDKIFETYSSGKHSKWIGKADLAIIFDVGDFRRLHALKTEIELNSLPTLNIDHHPVSGVVPYTLNVVDTNAAATGELLFNYFSTVSSQPWPLELYVGLYTAILTDTGSFRFSNTNSRCHEIAMACLRAGVDHTAIYQNIYEGNSLPGVRLLGKILSNLKIDQNGELAWFVIDQNMLTEVQASHEDVDGFTDYVRSIRGVEVALMIFEQSTDSCRINFRSKGKYIINEIAQFFGGGGHELAAGAVVSGRLETILPQVVARTIEVMSSQNGSNR